MFIVPISGSVSPVESLFENELQTNDKAEETASFSDVFKDIFHEVEATQAQSQEDTVRLIQGDIDDLHTIYNNMTKAAVAVETFVAVKNAAVDAYSQVLQITM